MDLPALGDIFEDRYRIAEVAGTGGFATVYRAIETTSGRQVALKILAPPYAPELVARFERETHLHARLTDPHTVRLLRHGQSASGLLWVAFEYVSGRTLADVLADSGPLPVEAVTHILRQLLAALSEAHRLGMLHRDIKPENILVFEHFGDPFRAKLLDFGLARPLAKDGSSSVTRTGEIIGTPRYMSPEQLTDDRLTPASDIYSLGLVAIEMMCGRDALHGRRWQDQHARILIDHRIDFPAPAGAAGARLADVVARMVARDPARRPPSAEAVLGGLDAIEREMPPAATANALPPARTSHRAIFAAAIAVAIALGAIVVMAARDTPPTPPSRSRPAASASALFAQPPAPSTPAAPPSSVEQPGRPAGGSSGCGRESSKRGTFLDSRMSGLADVTWFTHLPDEYDPNHPHPVVVLFHQDVRDGAGIIAQTAFDAVADEERFIIIAPNFKGRALPGPWRYPADVREVRSILDAVAERHCTDAGRTFLVGHGISGLAVEHLACEPWVTGIATNGWRMRDADPLCQPQAPVAHLHMAPMKSTRIPVAGGAGCMGLEEKIGLEEQERFWRTRNECAPERREHRRDGDHVCWTWSCARPFVSCHVQGGFNWPGSSVAEVDVYGCDAGTHTNFPATRVIWEFFAELPRSSMRD